MKSAEGARHARSGFLFAVSATTFLLVGAACGLAGAPSVGMDHQAAEPAGSAYDPGTMTRTFEAADAGGVETVVARSGQDQPTVNRARDYLQQEVAQFRQGHYADPAR